MIASPCTQTWGFCPFLRGFCLTWNQKHSQRGRRSWIRGFPSSPVLTCAFRRFSLPAEDPDGLLFLEDVLGRTSAGHIPSVHKSSSRRHLGRGAQKMPPGWHSWLGGGMNAEGRSFLPFYEDHTLYVKMQRGAACWYRVAFRMH